jgi:hypothetical protein
MPEEISLFQFGERLAVAFIEAAEDARLSLITSHFDGAHASLRKMHR